MTTAAERASSPRHASNASLLVPYVLPYFVYVGIGLLPTEWGISRELSYGLRLAVTALALGLCWSRYVSLLGPRSPAGSVGVGLLAGLAGTVLWVALKTPFYEAAGAAWSSESFLLRLAASGGVVPIFEELLFRGYLLRAAVQWDRARRRGSEDAFGEAYDRRSVVEVAPGEWTPLAVAISTLAFAMGHSAGEWIAALVYGLLMAGLWVLRKDLLSCVVAHGATNVALALYVLYTGSWGLW